MKHPIQNTKQNNSEGKKKIFQNITVTALLKLLGITLNSKTFKTCYALQIMPN